MRAITIIIGLGTILGMSFPTFGQVKEWGDVSIEELKKEVYPADSSAAAVVLFDKGNLRVEDHLSYYLDRHVRIKILREEGYEWGTVGIDYNTDYDQEVDDIKAATYTLNGNSIEEHKLGKRAIFEEQIVNDWRQKKFRLSSLQPGCIIEYKYTLKIGDPFYLPRWYFDRTIPVQWSELVAEFPGFLRFLKVFKGDEELYKNEFEEFYKTVQINYKTPKNSYGGTKTNRSSVNFNGEKFRWVMKDRKAIPDLVYMTTPNDYKASIHFQLAEFNIPNQRQRDYIKNWDNVFDELSDEGEFGSYLTDRVDFDNIYNSTGGDEEASLEKVEALFEYFTDVYKWDNTYGFLPDQRLKDLMRTKTGSGAELNLLLTRILREAGIEAYPVLISTRDHGKVSKKYVLPKQFNHVIVYVQFENRDLLLDSITGNRPLFNLPENDLNQEGLIVNKPYMEERNWINLMPFHKTVKVGRLQGMVHSDGSISGGTSYQATGYQAFKERTDLKKMGEERFTNEAIFDEFNNVSVTRFSPTNLDDLNSIFSYSADFKSGTPAGTQMTDSLIYLDTTPFMKWENNPLKQPERKYPVEYTYPFTEKFVAALTIPQGYKVESYPDDLITRIPREGGSFERTIEMKDGQILIHSTIKLERTTFSPEEYERLRLFFEQIIEAHSEKIVLKKDVIQNEG